MNFHIRQMTKLESDDLIRMIELKARYLKKAGFKDYPPFFDLGDHVGVFYPNPPQHVSGVIVKETQSAVFVKVDKKDQVLTVSPFQLFRLQP